MAIMNKFFTALLLCMSVGTTMLAQQTNSYKISESDIHVGYFGYPFDYVIHRGSILRCCVVFLSR